MQRGYLEHSAVNSPGRVLVTPGATTVLSQLNPRNRLCDPPRAAASVARRVGGPAREPVVRRPPSSAARSRLDGAEARSALSLEDSTSRVRRAGAVRLLIARKKVPRQVHGTPGFSPARTFPGNLLNALKFLSESLTQSWQTFSIRSQIANILDLQVRTGLYRIVGFFFF